MLRATQTFHVGTKDGTRTIENGATLEDDDPIVKSCAVFFEPADDGEQKPAKARRPAASKKS
jgi:hypothetical protein